MLDEIFKEEPGFLTRANTANSGSQDWLEVNWNKIIPLFVKTQTGKLNFVSRDVPVLGRDDMLVYLDPMNKAVDDQVV